MSEFIIELWEYMKERKKILLLPIILILIVFSAIVVATQGSAIAPFIYTMF